MNFKVAFLQSCKSSRRQSDVDKNHAPAPGTLAAWKATLLLGFRSLLPKFPHRMTRSRSRFTSLEVLESRIAPALLINGANLLGGGGPTTGESSAGGNSL